jgi:hypothetical protein
MIRFLAILAVFMALSVPAAHAQDVFIKNDGDQESGGSKPIFNAPTNSNSTGKSTVFKGAAPPKNTGGPDYMEQLMEENRQADYEIVKNKSIKTRDKIMKRRAERAEMLAASAKDQEAAAAAAAAAQGQPGDEAAAEEGAPAADQAKKVFVKKSTGIKTPKKVFNSYD